jgi:hypothetical protein
MLIPRVRKMTVLIMFCCQRAITHSARVVAALTAGYVVNCSVFTYFVKVCKFNSSRTTA